MSKIKKAFKNIFKHAGKSFVLFNVIGGQNYLSDDKLSSYTMRDESKDYGKGVVDINGELYYFLGAIKEEQYQQGKKRTISGTIIGGALAGGVGAIIGSQTRKKDKDMSTYIMELANYRSKERFTIQVESSLKNTMDSLSDFMPVNPKEIGLNK